MRIIEVMHAEHKAYVLASRQTLQRGDESEVMNASTIMTYDTIQAIGYRLKTDKQIRPLRAC